jgi:hypothetical protein
MLKHRMLWLCTFLVLISMGLAAQPKAFGAQAAAQGAATAKKPFDLAEIEKLLAGSVSPKRVATLVEQYGVSFELTDDAEKELRELGADGDLLLVISKKRVQPVDTTTQEWEAVRYSNNRVRLQAFFQRHPSGPFADAARAQIEQIDWVAANGSNDRSKLQAYLNQHSGGRFEQQAREQIEQIDWNSAFSSHDRTRIQAYIDQYPSGRYFQQAHEALEQIDWDAVKDLKDVQRLRAFLNAYPQGRYASSAKAAIEARAKVARAQQPQPQRRPDYCPLPDRINFDGESEHRDKLGIWTGTWEMGSARKFCIALTSIKNGKVLGIYSYERLARDAPGGFYSIAGTAKSTPSSLAIAAKAVNGAQVTISFPPDGSARAEIKGRGDVRWIYGRATKFQ